ncbi:MAG: hypothetical protein GY705_06195 [Bacteroidetes bacterium]|nr:hypothetical protein [Bacteroidota bacterium]
MTFKNFKSFRFSSFGRPIRLLTLFFFLLIITEYSCKQQTDSTVEETTQAQTEESTEQEQTSPKNNNTALYPSIPLETLQMLWQKCDYMDYVFYNMPFSMSLNEKKSIQSALRHISATPARINANCSSIGNVSYHVDGDIILEADFHFGQDCTYLVFYNENKEKAFANELTNEAVDFFQKAFANAQAQNPTSGK